MGRLSTEIEQNFWDTEFHKKITDSIDDKVKPAIENLKESTESAKEKLIRIFKKGVSISPLPIVASAGVIALDEYLESVKRKRKLRKNGFTYLFEAQKKF